MAYEDLLETYEKWADRMQHHGVGNMPFCIAFCGVFSSGKSSLLNALLGCGKVLPTGINTVTKIITRIRYGRELSLSYVVDGEAVPIPKAWMNDVITGERELPHRCTELIVEAPAAILKSNVEFIDTPGYEDDSALEDMSRAAVLTADLIVFCCNATMLGKQFEKQYLSELSLTHGNFCMVVNRADSLNTDEDREDVKNAAARLMKGRGNAAYPEEKQGQCFMTIADGRFANLNGFDQYIRNLLQDDQERKRIRQSTNRCFTSYHQEMLAKGIKEERMAYSAELKILQQADNARREKLELQNRMDQMRQDNKIENAKLYGGSLVRQKKSTIARGINGLPYYTTFVANAIKVVQSEVSDMIGTLAAYASSNDLVAGTRVRSELSQFLQCTIPEPTFHKERRYGILGCIRETITTSLQMGGLWIDDGMVSVPNDFHTPAIDEVHNHLDRFLQKWNKLLNGCKTQKMKNSETFMPNPQISELQEQICKLGELEEKMNAQEKVFSLQKDPDKMVLCISQQITQFRNWIIQLPMSGNICKKLKKMQNEWENGSIEVMIDGGFVCGKGTLVCALVGRELPTQTLPLEYGVPVKIVTCQTEEKVTVENKNKKESSVMSIAQFSNSIHAREYDENDEITIYTAGQGLGSSMISLVENPAYYHSKNRKSHSDALVFVTPAARVFYSGDCEFLKTQYWQGGNLFVVVTGMGQIADAEEEDALKESVKKKMKEILSGTSMEYSESFMNQRVFFTDAYIERKAQMHETVKFVGGIEIPANLIRTGIPELRTALKEYVFETDRIKAGIRPVFRYMCQAYGTLSQNINSMPNELMFARDNLNNLSLILYGQPLTEKMRQEIANGLRATP